MNKRWIFWIVFSYLWMNGCAQRGFVEQDSAFIVFKTPTLRYADMGFVYSNDNETKVEIYSSGQPLMSLKMRNGLVCMSTLACMDEKVFNEKVLSKAYPPSLLREVFAGDVIFGKDGYEKNRNGFTQKLFKNGKYAIKYSVLNRQISFSDTINHIIIKVKKQGEP